MLPSDEKAPNTTPSFQCPCGLLDLHIITTGIGKKYPGPDGSVIRWKRQVEREIGDRRQEEARMATVDTTQRRTKDSQGIHHRGGGTEAPSEDKDKEKDKEKKHVYSIDVTQERQANRKKGRLREKEKKKIGDFGNKFLIAIAVIRP
jgi:hypothetical protein